MAGRPAYPHTGLGPQSGKPLLGLAGSRLFISRGWAALRNFSGFRADFVHGANGAIHASGPSNFLSTTDAGW